MLTRDKNRTIVKPRVATAVGRITILKPRVAIYVEFSRRNKIPRSLAYTISEKATPVPASGL